MAILLLPYTLKRISYIGTYSACNANAQKRLEAYYNEGKLDGSVTEWRSNGKIHAIKYFEADSLVWEEYYNQSVQDSSDIPQLEVVAMALTAYFYFGTR